MYRLLNANFHKLKKDTIFWLFLFMSIGISLFTIIRYKNNISVGVVASLDRILCEFIWIIGLFISIFVSIFIGKEHSYGIIRNKIVAGCSRLNIYISNLIISVIASIICQILYMIITFSIGRFLFGKLQMNFFQFGLILLNTFLAIIAYCTIFNFIAMICSDVTISTIICIILFLTMFIVLSNLTTIVNADEYLETTLLNENGEYYIEKIPNPNYPSELKLQIARVIYFISPSGAAQEIQSASSSFDYLNTISNNNSLSTIEKNQNKNFKNLAIIPVYLLSLIVILNLSGIIVFNKKELK